MRHHRLLIAVLVMTLALAGCSRMHGEAELEQSRTQVVEAARSDLPAFAEALDAEIEDSWGRWSAGGAKNNYQLAYDAEMRLVGTAATSDEMADAITDLGYELIRNDSVGVMGERGDLTFFASNRHDIYRAYVSGPYLRTETGIVSAGREDLDLPGHDTDPAESD
ncbi:hypothetical protein [Actinotalea sp. C106]|uniref:hypothetical protein n=1 Tax=Actinotalea sp. C106 TaxID=2908644 RepID=UPI002027D6FC|nr:hypothetical protein [Actinotalea sp. C106]